MTFAIRILEQRAMDAFIMTRHRRVTQLALCLAAVCLVQETDYLIVFHSDNFVRTKNK